MCPTCHFSSQLNQDLFLLRSQFQVIRITRSIFALHIWSAKNFGRGMWRVIEQQIYLLVNVDPASSSQNGGWWREPLWLSCSVFPEKTGKGIIIQALRWLQRDETLRQVIDLTIHPGSHPGREPRDQGTKGKLGWGFKMRWQSIQHLFCFRTKPSISFNLSWRW